MVNMTWLYLAKISVCVRAMFTHFYDKDNSSMEDTFKTKREKSVLTDECIKWTTRQWIIMPVTSKTTTPSVISSFCLLLRDTMILHPVCKPNTPGYKTIQQLIKCMNDAFNNCSSTNVATNLPILLLKLIEWRKQSQVGLWNICLSCHREILS